ncbi:MAG TPA: HD domain-containing phosphohydrolase [Dehalococcoidia bacterium]|nr:HD domain-containing phosphohydrolase [Dehalococcoidia bacterium]
MYGSKSKSHLRFAIVSFIVVATFAAVFCLVIRALIAGSLESTAAATTRHGSGAQVRQAVFPGGPDVTASAVRARAAAAVPPLVAGDIAAVRIWSAGAPVFASGAAIEGSAAPSGSYARLRASDGTHLFAVYDTAGDYVIEVDRSASRIDGPIGTLQSVAVSMTAAFAVVLYIILQGAFWLSVRSFVGEHRRLQYLYTTGQEIRSSLDLPEVLAQIARDGTALARGQYGLVALFDHDTGDMILRTTYNHATGSIEQHQRAAEEWFMRRCVATNTTIASEQPASSYEQLVTPDMTMSGHVAVLCVPLSARGRVIGVVSTLRGSSLGGFTQAEQRVVEELADQAVMAVEQALLFAKMRSYADELELSYDSTLKVLMAALDTKDDATEGHCERVARLTSHLARAMNVPASALVDMERGALLHDVGKIGVPDAVLKKPKELNAMEWEAMRKHPLLAGVMVGKVGFLEGALPILLYHHERFDGGGYPFGLEGDKIPIDARIFAVVDSYDAMTSDRPYRKAMSHEDAMQEIRANSGTQFDPNVVAAFEAMMAAKPHLQARGAHAISDDHIDHDEEAFAAGEDEQVA